MKGYKTLAFLFLLAGSSIIGLSLHAQDPNVTNLGQIVVRFCNGTGIEGGGTKSLELKTEANKEEEICMYLDNSGPTDAMIGVNFVDGTITADEEGKKACEPDGVVENFGKYVNIESTGFIIPARGTLQTKATVKFPDGIAGKINGCVTYQIINDPNSALSGMFKIVSRRANFIDIIVSGEILFSVSYATENNPSFPNIGNSDHVELYMHPIDKKYSLKSTLTNTGNVPSESSISGTISAWRGWIQTGINVRQVKIPAKQKSMYEYQLPRRVEFGGPVNIELYTIDNAVIPSGLAVTYMPPLKQHFTINAFVLPIRVDAVGGVLFLLLIVSLKKRGKKK